MEELAQNVATSISPSSLGIRTILRNHFEPAQQGKELIVQQVFAVIAKAVLVTLVSTLAAVVVEQIRLYNEDRDEDLNYHLPQNEEYEHW